MADIHIRDVYPHDLLKRAKREAVDSGVTLKAWVIKAILDRIHLCEMSRKGDAELEQSNRQGQRADA